MLTLIASLIYACGTSTEESGDSETVETTAAESRYSYSNSFEMADKAHMETVKNWNNAIVEGDIDLAFTYVADSIDIILSDGSSYNTTKDSMKVVVNQFMEDISFSNIDFLASMAVTSTDMNETWVLNYTDESYTSAEGEERSIIHEVYRIVDSKIRSVYQYAQVPVETDVYSEPQDGIYRYSGSFEMMDNQNIDVVNGWMDALVAKDWDAAANFLSDSVTVIFSDGTYLNTVSDSLIAGAREYFEGATIEIDFVAAIAVKSTVQDDDWVLSWTDENYIRSDTTERVVLHEAYRLDDNRITFIRQFSRTALEE